MLSPYMSHQYVQANWSLVSQIYALKSKHSPAITPYSSLLVTDTILIAKLCEASGTSG